MDSDQEDYVFCGTPIEREEEVATRKKKAVAEASGNLRSLPAWKQEVTDEEGRRRFHGAFTGGFSAGYYNTVGSKEGWAPQTFTSSRKNRAELKQQSILNFLDEDEKADLEGQSLKTSMQFDTFGFTSAELVRKQAEKEQHHRPSAIPGPVPDELILPATESVGVKLLLKMGWRHGHSVKDSHASSLHDARREARKAFLAFSSDDAKTTADAEPVKGDLESLGQCLTNDGVQSSQSTPVYVLNPKNNLHGLGFDPFKHAPEFREKKRLRASDGVPVKDNLFGLKSRKAAPGFGIGALEELDAEDEDVYSTTYELENTHVQEEEEEEPPRLIMDEKKRLTGKEQGVLYGFKIASNSDFQLERFDPPVIPKDYIPQHKFPGPLESGDKASDPPPPEVPSPEDNNLKVLIEGVATLVARCGKLFEDLSREKNQSNPLFNFLCGGTGSDYYARKLWEECQKHTDKPKLQLVGKLSPNVQKMTAESRGQLLGEKPLERSSKDTSSFVPSADLTHLQVNLKDTFRKPASSDELLGVSKPFTFDPAKQERFERFLKEKYEGGLRSTYSAGASNMSESDRARERLDFESAAEAIEKGKWSRDDKLSVPQFMEFAAAGGTKFTSGGFEQIEDPQAEEIMMKNMYPKREEFQWRPASVLCKRFDLTDPYMGKPPPAPRMRSKMDSLIFMPDSVKATKGEETPEAFSMHQSGHQGPRKDDEQQVEVENVERPVDLYKAIFSDDSDEEAEIPILDKVENPEKKAEAANTTLNRLIAGDFLESLGKELGLEVPPEIPSSMNKAESLTRKENMDVNAGKGNSETYPSSGVQRHQGIAPSISNETKRGGIEPSLSENVSGKAKEKLAHEDRKAKTPPSRSHILGGNSSSEDERGRKSSRRRHRHKSSDTESDSDSSSEHKDRSRSKGRKKESYREKSSGSSRRRSKSHKHRRRESPSSRSYGRDKERSEGKREKRKWRD